MDFRFFVFSIILSICIFVPSAFAQIGIEPSNQKSVEVFIDSNNDVNVKHVIRSSNSPVQIDLIEGVKTNLKVVNEEGENQQFGVIGNNDSLLISPSRDDVIIEYDITGGLIRTGNLWTWDFLYLERTVFFFPDEIDLIFVNENPVFLGEKKGIQCHGCQMLLEYSVEEPKTIERLNLDDKEYHLEFRTWAEINNINFEKSLGSINFEIEQKNEFVTTVVPLNLLAEPFEVFLNEEKIIFNKFLENGTHVSLNIRPQNSGEVSIQGTVVPNFEENGESESFPNEYLIVIFVVVIGGIVGGIVAFKKR